MINRLKKSKAGFTIIELLVVIAIISVLSAIAIPQYTTYKVKAYDTAALSAAKNCYTSLQAFMADNPSILATDLVTVNAISGGFVPTTGVTTTVAAGIITSQHDNGSAVYTVGLNGGITKI